MTSDRAMHDNSLRAHSEEKEAGRLSARCAQIREVFERLPGRDLTDREVMAALGFTDPNKVRPRITEMVKARILEETAGRIDCETRKNVRTVRLMDPAGAEREQGKLF